MKKANNRGQLIFPIIAILFLFGLFWVTYVLWCRTIYWKMRMDATAEMVALSAARDQALQMNVMGTVQWLENPFIQKAEVFSEDIAHMQIAAKNGFEAMNGILKLVDWQFEKNVLAVAQIVAKVNGADLPAIPLTPYGHQLHAQTVHVFYFAHLLMVGEENYKGAYFTRTWLTRQTNPQPPHKTWWRVCHGNICQQGGASLWLDVRQSDIANNGGFPSPDASFWRKFGIQCFYPQFSARLLYPKFNE